jgi:hypothetical protein
MALPTILVDSSFLYSVIDHNSPSYVQARQIIRVKKAIYLVPEVTLTETAFLFRRQGGSPAVARFLAGLTVAKLPFVSVTQDDLVRAREILLAYPTAKLDFVDCCIAALAERMNITQLCTYDQRDFSIIRPRHVGSFVLLP